MLPVLLTIGNFPVSSFGLFLFVGIFAGAFAVWRIARSFDFESEKVLDLIFLTLGSGLLFSRIIFIAINWKAFDSFSKMFFINRYPGLSFWGGLLGGILALWWLSKRFKTSFFQAADWAMIGFFAAAFWVEIGCLLGACDSGMATNWFLSVDQAGVIGKRLPVQLFEALVFLWIFWVFWKRVLKFHVQGKFLSSGLMMLGLVKLIASLFKEPAQNLNINSVSIRLDLLFPAAVFLLGLYFHYKIYKKTPVTDLASTGKFLVNPKSQRSMISKFMRWCYNQKANFWVSLERSMKKILKLLNVRSNPEHFRNK